MTNVTGRIGGIQGVYADSGRFIGISDPTTTGDGADYLVPTYATDTNGNVTGLVAPDGSVIGTPNALTSTRSTTTADNGVTLSNATASNYTVTVAVDTIAQATMLQQESTGTITLVAGAGVTFIGASLATAGQGGILTILPTSTANTYIVKLSA